jgi:hypothetical protein
MTLPHGFTTFRVVTILFLLAMASNLSAQTSSTSSTGSQSTADGIQKHWNEWGIWGGISFDAPTLIGKIPSARFGEVGLRYGRVLAASRSVAFEWTIDAIGATGECSPSDRLPAAFSISATRCRISTLRNSTSHLISVAACRLLIATGAVLQLVISTNTSRTAIPEFTIPESTYK